MKDTILSISGRPGLFRLVARGARTIIVETIDNEKRRLSAGMHDRVTSLNDISMYSADDDIPLMDVLQNIADKYHGAPVPIVPKTAGGEELAAFMTEALPTYDRNRVRNSDIRKLIQWYNVLVAAGYTEFADKEEAPKSEGENGKEEDSREEATLSETK